MPRLEDDLAASFRQGTHLAQRDPAASPEGLLFGDAAALGGVCFALSALWVCRHMAHRAEGPAGRAAYLARDSTLLAAMAAHREAAVAARLALPPEMPVDSYRDRILGAFGLGCMPVALGQFHCNGRAMEQQMSELLARLSASHSYHFLSFFGHEPALGHAMACYTASSVPQGRPMLYLFDPNWGEFKVSAPHAPHFLARLFDWYAGHREFGRITRLSLGRLVPQD